MEKIAHQDAEQTKQAASVIAPLKKVTPLSKYLAMALFIILPFVSGYLGYVLSPEKVLEVGGVIEVGDLPNEDRSLVTDEGLISSEVPHNQFERTYVMQFNEDAQVIFDNPDSEYFDEYMTMSHPARYSIVEYPDTVIVENVETLIPEELHDDYSAVSPELTQLSDRIVLFSLSPVDDGHSYMLRLDTETREVTNLGRYSKDDQNEAKDILVVTDEDNSRITFIDTLTAIEIDTLESESNDVVFGACEKGCYVFGKWVQNDSAFVFNSVTLSPNYGVEDSSITIVDSHAFYRKDKSIVGSDEFVKTELSPRYDPWWWSMVD